MKRCPSCKTFYSSYAAACPKCGIRRSEAELAEVSKSAPSKKEVRRDWLWIVIGVPALIGVIYLIIWIMKQAM